MIPTKAGAIEYGVVRLPVDAADDNTIWVLAGYPMEKFHGTYEQAKALFDRMVATVPGCKYCIRRWGDRLGKCCCDTYPTKIKRDEAPCPTCLRPNDRGVKCCWNCGQADPYPKAESLDWEDKTPVTFMLPWGPPIIP